MVPLEGLGGVTVNPLGTQLVNFVVLPDEANKRIRCRMTFEIVQDEHLRHCEALLSKKARKKLLPHLRESI